MKFSKKSITLTAATLLAVATSMTVFASSMPSANLDNNYSNPAQIVADLTERTEESILKERQETGKTYGQIAAEAGQSEAFNEAFDRFCEENGYGYGMNNERGQGYGYGMMGRGRCH